MDAKTAVLTYFAPALGVVLANLMFISPVAGVREARLAGALKELNPVPYPFIIANCINWVVYGTLIKNLWVFWSNGPGILLGVYLTISALPLASPKQRYQVEIMVLVLMGLEVFILGLAGTISKDIKTMTAISGYLSNVVLFVYYGSPLSTLWQVVQKRDSTSLYFPLSLASTINGSAWTAYGLAVGDSFIFIPNCAGAVLGVVQLVLIFLFKKRRRVPMGPAGIPKDNSEEWNTGTSSLVPDNEAAIAKAT